MIKSSILIISFSPLDRDPRVQRQIRFLQNDYKISAAGFSDPAIEGIKYIPLPFHVSNTWRKTLQAIRLKTRCFDAYYWNVVCLREAYNILSGKNWNLILANDLFSLPLALKLAGSNGAKVLVDAHEYEPLHFDDNWYFNFFYKAFWDYIAKEYLPRADALITVCEGIATAYTQNYGVSCGVITNACHYHQLGPTETAHDSIRMIHHGICNPSRRLENMIGLMAHLDKRFTLDMMLVPDNQRYYRKLVGLAEHRPNIRMRDPVPLKDIVKVLNDYDLGLFLLSPKAFNYRMALPNKLFEFIQARLGVAVWPSPEMAVIVRQFKLGVVADEYSIPAAAAVLNRLSVADIQQFKQHSHEAAPILCAEQNSKQLLRIVRRLIGS
jgi:hypothetical protein